MVFQWCKKVLSAAKETVKNWLPRPKPTPPVTARYVIRTVISYIEQITKRGAGVGENIMAGGWYAFPTLVTPVLYIPMVPFAVAAFGGKFFHRSESSIKRFIALLSRNFLKMAETTPALLSIGGVALAISGASLDPGSPGFIPIFFTSIALSLLKFGLDKKFAKTRSSTQTVDTTPLTEEDAPSKGRRFIRWIGRQVSKLPPLARNMVLPILKKAGQGALLRKIFSAFIIGLYQEEGWVSQNSEPSAATSPWLYLFIILPVAMKISLLIAEKAIASERKRGLENVNIGFEAIADGGESLAIITLLTARVITSFYESYTISDEDYFACMGVGALCGSLGTYFSLEKSLKHRRKVELAAITDLERQVAILDDGIEMDEIQTSDRLDSSYAVMIREGVAGVADSSFREVDAAADQQSLKVILKDDQESAEVALSSDDVYNMTSTQTERHAVYPVENFEETGEGDRMLLLSNPPN